MTIYRFGDDIGAAFVIAPTEAQARGLMARFLPNCPTEDVETIPEDAPLTLHWSAQWDVLDGEEEWDDLIAEGLPKLLKTAADWERALGPGMLAIEVEEGLGPVNNCYRFAWKSSRVPQASLS